MVILSFSVGVLLTACTPTPPTDAETVILVHGLGRTPASMAVLSSRLKGAGFRVVNFGYPSTSAEIEVLVDSLELAVVSCCGGPAGRLHFVTHSMGGVLVRSYLAERAPGFAGHVVMLSPPNQGSEVIDAFENSPLIRSLLGPAATRLGTDSSGIAQELGPIDFSLGIITGDRSINWMRYSATLIQFPLGLIATAVSIAILPMLSRQATSGRSGLFKDTLARGLRLVLALTIPATVGLWVLATPIVALVFEHGDFTPADTLATVAALRCHLVGLIFAAVDQPLIFAFYASKDTWTPALAGVATVILYVILALAPMLVVSLTLNGLILANSLKLVAHALVMLVLLQHRMGGLSGHGMWGLVFRVAVASAVMGGAVHLVVEGMAQVVPAGLVGEALLVGGGGLAGAAIYGVLAVLLRVEEVGLLGRALLEWGRRLTGPGR